MDNLFHKDKEWECQICGSMNDYSHNTCRICDGAKNKLEIKPEKNYDINDLFDVNPQIRPDVVQWDCQTCSMMNEKHNRNCVACLEMNPFFKLCPQCHSVDIDVRTEKCDNCIRLNDRKAVDMDYTKLQEASWTCTKCSLRNESNMQVCEACHNVGPLHNSWQCAKCTLINQDWLDNCTVCGMVKPVHENPFNFIVAFLGTNIPIQRPLETGPDINARRDFKPTLCRCCRKAVQNNDRDDDQLCDECEMDYYICKHNHCGMLMESVKDTCKKCGAHRANNIPNHGWQCSWEQCKTFNEEENKLCDSCCGYRDTDENKVRCVSCGWINFKVSNCKKCGIRVR